MNNLKYSNGSATYVESLEKKIAELEKQIVAIDMKNEPVAWRCNKFYENQEGWFYNENEIGEPLYTHPVELTDEEIAQVMELLDEAKKLADDIAEYAPSTNLEIILRNLIKEIERLQSEKTVAVKGKAKAKAS